MKNGYYRKNNGKRFDFSDITAYINQKSWRNKENANFNYSYSGLQAHVVNKKFANYALSQLPYKARRAHIDGDFHIHNLESGWMIGYCNGGSLLGILTKGVRSADIQSKPARHFDTALSHCVNWFFMSQLEWTGAQALSDFDVLLAPFIRYDGLSFERVKQNIQRMVWDLNFACRQSFQSPFSNLSFDMGVPKQFRDMPVIAGGKPTRDSYEDFMDEIYMINEAFAEVLMERDAVGRPFTFPIPTVNLTKRTDCDSDAMKKILAETAYLGSYYFMNYCLAPNTQVIVLRDGRVIRQKICNVKANDYIESPEGFVRIVNVFHRPYSDRLVRIKLRNGAWVECTEDHTFPTIDGEKTARDIKVGDAIEISAYVIDGEIGDYDTGKMIGLYLAEGWKCDAQVYFSNKDKEVIEFLDTYSSRLGSRNWIQERKDGVIILVCNSKGLAGIIDNYCIGKNAKDKRLRNKAFSTSVEFRRGIIDGWLIGDGSKRDPCGFSYSSRLVHDMSQLMRTLGKLTSVNISTNNQYSSSPHSLWILSDDWSTKIINKNGKKYCRVVSISRGKGKPEEVIDITVESSNHYFTLANGIVTHNCGSGINEDTVRAMCCRLNLDTSKLSEARGLWNMSSGTGCYDEETEILTDEGWKYFEQLTGKELVLTMNMDNNNLEWQPILTFYKYHVQGKLVHVKNKTLDFLVTPNHRMIVRSDPRGKNKEVRADHLSTCHSIPNDFRWCGTGSDSFVLESVERGQYGYSDEIRIDSKLFAGFMGIYLAEGCYDNSEIAPSHGYRVTISQRKHKYKKQQIRSLLEKLPFHFRETENGFELTNKQLWTYVSQFGRAKTKFVPRWIKESSPEIIEEFLNWYHLGDGTFDRRGRRWFYTSSKQLADDVQECLVKLGRKSRIFCRERDIILKGRKIHGRFYEISESKSKSYFLPKIEFRDYSGYVYCVEVPNNTLIVRRMGVPIVCGNSVGVVSLNMGRLGYLGRKRGDDWMYDRIDYLMDMAAECLKLRKENVATNIERGLLPFAKFYDVNLDHYFMTIGVIGLNEMSLNHDGVPLSKNPDFVIEVLEHMRDKLVNLQESTGNLFNLEMTPAEGASYRLALIDRKKYREIKTLGTKSKPYYSALLIPPSDDVGLFKRIEIEEKILPLFTGGTVFRNYIGSHPDLDSLKNYIRKLSTTRIPYFDITCTFSICPNDGRMYEEIVPQCPECGATTEVYSRVVGYYRATNKWNIGKQQEFKDRQYIKINSEIIDESQTTLTT